jgi:hypothetical protein
MNELTGFEATDQAPIYGDKVAWVSVYQGKTSGVSSIHRVYVNGKTFCNHTVPHAARLLPPLVSLDVCRRCEAMYQRARKYEDAHQVSA